MTTMNEVVELVNKSTTEMEKWVKRNNDERDLMRAELDAVMIKMNRPGGIGGSGTDTPTYDKKMVAEGIRALLSGKGDTANQLFQEAKAMSVGTDPDGGYLVTPQFSSGLTKILAEISPFYGLARRITLSKGDSFEEVIDKDQAPASWVGEVESRPETNTPQVGKFRIELNEVYAQPKVTQKLLDIVDFDLESWLQSKITDAFSLAEGTAYHTGNGVARPRGFMTYPTVATADATREWGKIQHIATGASGAFPTSSATVNPADVLIDCVSAMKTQYRNGAVWIMNRLTAGACRKLKDADGRHVWQESLIAGQPSTILGYDVVEDEGMPDISAGSLSIAFMNPQKSYCIVERPGVRFITDNLTDKPNVKLYAFRRVGGGVFNYEPIKFLKFA